MTAASGDNQGIVELLLINGAGVDSKDNDVIFREKWPRLGGRSGPFSVDIIKV